MLSPSPLPLPTSLVVKKRFEDVMEMVRRDTPSGIRDGQAHAIADGPAARHLRSVRPDVRVLDRDVQYAAVRHGVAGVERQVENGRFQLMGIDQNQPEDRRRSGSADRWFRPKRAAAFR